MPKNRIAKTKLRKKLLVFQNKVYFFSCIKGVTIRLPNRLEEEKMRNKKNCILVSIKHGELTLMNFHSNSKSQIIARNVDGAVFRYKLLDFTVDEIKNI